MNLHVLCCTYLIDIIVWFLFFVFWVLCFRYGLVRGAVLLLSHGVTE